MAAPAVILVGRGNPDKLVTTSLFGIQQALCRLRPDLQVEMGLTEGVSPTVRDVAHELASSGSDEVALVPLSLVRAVEHSSDIAETLTSMAASYPEVTTTAARPVGPAAELLSILDLRLRSALQARHVLEVDGLVLAVPAGADARGSSLLARRARQWSAHHKLPVQLAVNDDSGRASGAAVAALRAEGRRHIAVGSMFLIGDRQFTNHQRSAFNAGAVAVTPPIGADPRLLELILARYAYAAMDMLDLPSA